MPHKLMNLIESPRMSSSSNFTIVAHFDRAPVVSFFHFNLLSSSASRLGLSCVGSPLGAPAVLVVNIISSEGKRLDRHKSARDVGLLVPTRKCNLLGCAMLGQGVAPKFLLSLLIRPEKR